MSAAPRSRKLNSSTDSSPPLSSYRKAYLQADTFCREVQNFEDEAGIPAMNEMRYAGHHLLVALDDYGAIADKEQLTKALNHTKRACYEASEAGILTALSAIAKFKVAYSNIIIGDIVKHYSDILIAAEKAKEVIESRNHKVEESSDGEDVERVIESYAWDTDVYMESFRKLKGYCHVLDLHRDELNKRLKAINDDVIKERREARRFFLTMLIGVPGLILAAVSLLVAYLAWVKPHEPKPDGPVSTVIQGTPSNSSPNSSAANSSSTAATPDNQAQHRQ